MRPFDTPGDHKNKTNIPIVRQSIATAMHPPVGDVKSYFMFVLSPFKTLQKFKKSQEN